jgi:Tetrapyrrole (Corrin/Porphyrin) Methylases
VTRSRGSLTVVSTGIKAIAQITQETRHRLEMAEKVLYLFADPITTRWVQELNPTAESMEDLYKVGTERREIYAAMVQRILSWVRRDFAVCAAFYGHAGVFVAPGHEAVRRAQAEGFDAELLPGVSAEDCLFADLGIDPAAMGCQSYEATDFLLHPKRFDASVPLVLWQVGVVGSFRHVLHPDPHGIRMLAEYLLQFYRGDHVAVIYEAAQLPVCGPRITEVKLNGLPHAPVPPLSTLYVPPAGQPTLNVEMYSQFGVDLPNR